MNSKDQNESKDDLVAYLDGELKGSDREQVEAAINSDASVRSELAQLQKTWDLLDVLPTVNAPDSFTQSTVEMVALNIEKSPAENRHYQNLLWAGLLLLAVLIPVGAFFLGYLGKKKDLDSPNRQVKADLPIIENLPYYRSVNAEVSAARAIQFLELLADDPGIYLESEGENPTGLESALPQESVGNDPPPVINVETVGKAKLEELLLNRREFDRLSKVPHQQQNLRQFHEMLHQHAKSDDLQAALIGYHFWLKNKIYLGQDEIDRIMDLRPEERIQQIKQMEQEQFDRRFGRFRTRRSAPSRQDFGYIKNYGKRKLEQVFLEIATLDATANPEIQELKDSVKNAPTRHHGFAILMQSSIPLNSLWSSRDSDNELELFLKGLSDESRQLLDDLSPEFQEIVIRNWILRSIMEIEDSDLQDFYDNGLTGTQRYSLRGLSTKERKQVLTEAVRLTLSIEDTRELPDDMKQLLEDSTTHRPNRKSAD